MEDIQKLLEATVILLKDTNAELSYESIGWSLHGNGTSFDQAVIYLASSVICHNIPYYLNNNLCTRQLNECLRDVITFYNAHDAECEIIYKSNTKILIDNITGYQLPRLKYKDASHKTFKSGSGNSNPDLEDFNGNTFEVKRECRKGSRSGLHKAQYLIDCTSTTIEVREIGTYGGVDFDHYPLGRFNGVLSEKIVKPLTTVDNSLMRILYNGDLIEQVEKLLEIEGFVWNSTV